MDLSVEDFVNGLLKNEATEKPSDLKPTEDLDFRLPPWFDEKKFNKGRQFFWTFSFGLATSMLMGLVAVFAVPSILRVLVGSRRSSSTYTAYKRYLSTLLHTVSWFQHELKPGSTSWKSLKVVRERHFRAGMAAKALGQGIVSQRDLSLTMFGFVGFSILKPDKFGVRQFADGDWEAYNHFWRTIGYMIGIEDRYNLCRNTIQETRQACQMLLERVFTPCLENVPEHFEHMARVMLDGMWSVNPTLNINASLYWVRHLADVPGYIYTENDRIQLVNKIKTQLKGSMNDIGVDTTSIISKPALQGLPSIPPRLLFLSDYQALDSSPAYKRLTFIEKYRLNCNNLFFKLYDSYLGRLYFNLNYLWSLFLIRYFPYLAFIRFGIRESMVDIFVEDPKDNEKPKLNEEYYKKTPLPWYSFLKFW